VYKEAMSEIVGNSKQPGDEQDPSLKKTINDIFAAPDSTAALNHQGDSETQDFNDRRLVGDQDGYDEFYGW
jgi:hypothetical protein